MKITALYGNIRAELFPILLCKVLRGTSSIGHQVDNGKLVDHCNCQKIVIHSHKMSKKFITLNCSLYRQRFETTIETNGVVSGSDSLLTSVANVSQKSFEYFKL